MRAQTADVGRHVAVMVPPPKWSLPRFRELWLARELVYFLAWRDLKVRYTQAALGVTWSVLQPLIMMVVSTLVFGRLVKVPSSGVPYPVFAFAGLLPWTFFANAVASSTQSLVNSANMISKVYFPRLALPVAALIAWLPDLGIASILLVFLMLAFGVVPAWTIVLVPAFALLALLAAASVSIGLAALNVTYRDVRYVVPFLLQIWLFLTPVLYPPRILGDRFRFLLAVNPMTGVVEGFRWSVLGHGSPAWGLVAGSCVSSLVLLAGGLLYFRRMEHSFADVV